MFRIYALIIVLGLLGSAAYGAKYYYDSTQARIATLTENNAKLEVAIKTSQETIDRLAQDAVEMEQHNRELTTQLQEASAYKDELLGKLQKHNLSLLSLKKPGLIETRINKGTRDVFNELEQIGIPNRDTEPTPTN